METREQITSYPLALPPPRDYHGGGAGSSPERGDGRRRAAPSQPGVAGSVPEKQLRHAPPRGSRTDAPGRPRIRSAPTHALIITDAQGRNPALQPRIPSPFLAQHIAQEVLGPEDHPSRHRSGSAAYLTVRDSTTEILGAADLLDLIV